MKNNKKIYLAYGSNLNINQMMQRCPDARIYGSSEIENYKLEFCGSETNAYATIKKCENNTVSVGLWEISKQDEKNLDIYEGYPKFYKKEIIKVNINNIEIDALCYIMDNKFKKGISSENYENIIREGYEDFGLDIKKLNKSIIENLKEVKMLNQNEIYTFKNNRMKF